MGGFLSLLKKHRRKAVISILYRFRNDMVYSGPEQSYRPEPTPEPIEYSVAVGDEAGSVLIKKITGESITVKTLMEYAASDRKPSDTFTIKKGETLCLTECGLCDAAAQLIITYIE